jgi:hypothetical protein
MNAQILRPGGIAAGAVVIGGTLVLAMPQHAGTIVRLVIVTVAAAAALYALGFNAPPRWWLSPFDRSGATVGTRTGSREIDRVRSELSGWRQRIPGGSPLPPEVVRMLQPLIEVAIERAGLRPGDRRVTGTTRTPLSPLIRGILRTDSSTRPPWYRMVRPDRREVAATVHRVLDELDRIAAGAAGVRATPTRDPRAT